MLFGNSLKIHSAMNFILVAECHCLMGYLASLGVGKNLLDDLQLIPHIARFNLVHLPVLAATGLLNRVATRS
jgi:hypothetical protein